MFIGVNTNIKYKDEIFHIQTEDGGLDQHTLTTILFKNGAILSSKKTSYIDIPKSPTYDNMIKEMMQEQHKQMARDLVSGKFTNPINPAKDETAASEANRQVSEEKKAPLAADCKAAPSSLGPLQTSPQKNVLDVKISEYLKKKDAQQV